MTKREILIKTINHEECGVIPHNIGFTGDFVNRVIAEKGDLSCFGNIDNYIVDDGDGSSEFISENIKRDHFGVEWLMDQRGDFGVVNNYLIKEYEDLDTYEFPEPDYEALEKRCKGIVERAGDENFRMFCIGFSLFERAWSLRSMEELLMDFILEPEFVHKLMGKITEYNLKVINFVSQFPLDGIYFGDDWGQQKGLIMGYPHWCEYIKPYLGKMYAAVKSKGLYICQHSCGDISEVFDDVIELGLDIYNTFQPEIYDVEKVKEEYGDRLTFFGGISTQVILPHGTPEEVKAETKRMMKVMGKNGGYIVAPTHSVPDDVPAENIIAFLEAVREQY